VPFLQEVPRLAGRLVLDRADHAIAEPFVEARVLKLNVSSQAPMQLLRTASCSAVRVSVTAIFGSEVFAAFSEG